MVALCQITKDDHDLLSSRAKDKLIAEELKTFEDAVHLYPKNEIVDTRNNEVLRKGYQHLILVNLLFKSILILTLNIKHILILF